MKKFLCCFTIVAVMVLIAGVGAERTWAAESDEPIVLKFGTHLTENHVLTLNAVIPWMELVTKFSGGQVTFEHYPNSQMGKATDAYPLVNSGVLDCAYTLYMNQDLPITDICSLPGLYENCEYATYAFWDVLNQEPFAGLLAGMNIKPIMCVAWEPYTISTVKEKPQTLEDFTKLKLRSSGGLHDQAAAVLGISPIAISAAETLEALQKGTVDGCWSSTTAKTDYQWTQVLKYSITNLPFPGWGGFFSMNAEVYNSLPDNAKQAIDKACEEMSSKMGTNVKVMCDEAWDITAKAGMENYAVSAEVVDEIKNKFAPITKEWLDFQDNSGQPATEVYKQFLEAYAQYAKK